MYVTVTEGIGFNIFSVHDVQARQTIVPDDKDDSCVFNTRLTFSRDQTGSCLLVTRMDPTPSLGLTAVPALSGVHPAPFFSENGVPGVSASPLSPLT